MHRDFRRRQAEDQPPMTRVSIREHQGFAEKPAVSVRVLAVDDRMSTDDHAYALSLVVASARAADLAGWPGGGQVQPDDLGGLGTAVRQRRHRLMPQLP
jgi:hypothetical protein